MLPVIVATAGTLLMAATNESPPGAQTLKQRLQAIAAGTVFFGHRSVGANVLDGLQQLAREQGVELHIAQVPGAAGLRPGTFGHLFIEQYGDPVRRLATFTTALRGGDPDVALVKLCYLDFDANTDARAVFAAYEATLRDLRAQHPRTTFVQVTAPLKAEESFVKSLAKKLLGKSSRALPSNARREEFNALVRSTFRSEPLFDLARVESTDSSGRTVTASLDGKAVPMLAAEYTSDGGHLNAEGSKRAALALVNALGDAFAARAAGHR